MPSAKAEQDALLDPGVDAPAGGRCGVGRGGAEFAALEGRAQFEKGGEGGGIADGGGTGGKMALDGLLELCDVHCFQSLSIQGGEKVGEGKNASREEAAPEIHGGSGAA